MLSATHRLLWATYRVTVQANLESFPLVATHVLCHLLSNLTPDTARSYSVFCSARDSIAQSVASIAGLWKPDPTGSNAQREQQSSPGYSVSASGSAASLHATLRAPLRQLRESREEYFDLEEHTVAVGVLCGRAQKLAVEQLGQSTLEQLAGNGLAIDVALLLFDALLDQMPGPEQATASEHRLIALAVLRVRFLAPAHAMAWPSLAHS